ncbi:HD-GYP domain-containing protein [Lysinibacillus yapensis]|uniref:HD-GYP domain-containing protein n=1 Tax=Ureibacillus yapensis TaxID=2304605 RepID=A0A396S7G6_9BACL|nr:HD-GYP domain-containing protein [Lysinibacillus yapensis]RHW36801.1 HD-GYP domain-containing protein [Lysinibacillus yapensis]
MRLISINVVKPGMVNGKTIWNEAGLPLIQRDVVLSDRLIDRLKQLKIQYVYIEDGISDGIAIEETVPIEVRKKAVKQITGSFHEIKGLRGKTAALVIDKKTKEIGKMVDDLLDCLLNSDEMLMVLTDTLLYDEYIYQHSFQVTLYSLAIAKELEYSRDDLKMLGLGALLHDVGKMQVPCEILFKPGRLTDEEFEIMKQHSRDGFEILRNLHTVSLIIAHCAFQHHERMDGSGYPRGLVGGEIHPYAKIIAVADVFDAVTSNRVYRNKMLPSQGIDIIQAGRGKIFDEKVVDAFLKSVVHYPNGTILLLSDGRRGIVVKQNMRNAALPSLRIFEENGQLLKSTYLFNLAEEANVSIEKVETDYIAETE